jgi:hypothetical protein
MRPSLPRSADLAALANVPHKRQPRDARGRLLKGSALAAGKGWKRAIAKAMSTEGLEGDAALVANDARKLFLGALRELPSSGALVRTNAYGHAREAALAGYFDAKANEAGLDTEKGQALIERASHHRQLAMRLSVVVIDVAARMALTEREKPRDWAKEFQAAAAASPQPAPEPEDEKPSQSAEDAPGTTIEPSEPLEPLEPVREGKRVVEAIRSSTESREVGFGNALSQSVPDVEVAPSVSLEERKAIANEARRRLLGLCPHDLNPAACPQCFQVRERERIATERAKIARDRR